jgi:hypothetical protein
MRDTLIALLCLTPANILPTVGSGVHHSISEIQEVRSLRTTTAARATRHELEVQARIGQEDMEADMATLGLQMAPQVSVAG